MRGPSIRDWLLLLVSGTFTIAAISLAALKRDSTGLAVGAFFGAALAVAVRNIARKRQLKKHAQAIAVEVQEGVAFRATLSSFLIWTLGTALTGLMMATFGRGAGAVVTWVGAGMAILGVVISLLAASGVWPRPFLQFERDGIRFGQAGVTFVLEWRNIEQIAPGELSGHDLLLIGVRDIDRLLATASPPEHTCRLANIIGWNRQWYGADIAIMTMQYGTDSALLAHAMRRYLSGEAVRGSDQDAAVTCVQASISSAPEA